MKLLISPTSNAYHPRKKTKRFKTIFAFYISTLIYRWIKTATWPVFRTHLMNPHPVPNVTLRDTVIQVRVLSLVKKCLFQEANSVFLILIVNYFVQR